MKNLWIIFFLGVISIAKAQSVLSNLSSDYVVVKIRLVNDSNKVLEGERVVLNDEKSKIPLVSGITDKNGVVELRLKTKQSYILHLSYLTDVDRLYYSKKPLNYPVSAEYRYAGTKFLYEQQQQIQAWKDSMYNAVAIESERSHEQKVVSDTLALHSDSLFSNTDTSGSNWAIEDSTVVRTEITNVYSEVHRAIDSLYIEKLNNVDTIIRKICRRVMSSDSTFGKWKQVGLGGEHRRRSIGARNVVKGYRESINRFGASGGKRGYPMSSWMTRKKKYTLAKIRAMSLDKRQELYQKERQTVLAILNRNRKWSKIVVVTDVTGSMRSYYRQVIFWHQINFENQLGISYTFFNDGDNKKDDQKKIGQTGGIYTVGGKNPNLTPTVKKAIRGRKGGDLKENDLEACMKASASGQHKSIVLVADNASGVRDMVLLDKIKIPIRVVLCKKKNQPIHPDYLMIASKTGGSVHTIEEDFLELDKKIADNKIEIAGHTYNFLNGKFVLKK